MPSKKKNETDWIFDFVRQNADRPMKIKELARAASISSQEYPSFRHSIKALLDAGLLVKLKRNRIGLPEQMNLVTGTISITKSGIGFVQPDNKSEEIYIAPRDLGTAFDHDRVTVRLRREVGFKGKREGAVINILERRTAQVVGVFHKGKNYDYVVPDTKSINRDVYIVRGKTKRAQDGEKVVVRLADWKDPFLNPEGEVIERLGRPGDPGVDMEAIIRQFNLPTHFPQDVLDEADSIAEEWQSEIDKRPDLTRISLFTIDPIDARDHDDAVSIEMVDGRWRLGVHIADVSHFVRSGTKLDKEAFERGTSVYFPDRVLPMLPEKLSNDLCSLRPNRKRLAYSIIMDFSPSGNAVDYQLFPSVIKSRAKLAYEEVQALFSAVDDNPDVPPEKLSKQVLPSVLKVAGDLLTMRELARVLFKRREAAGSLDFDLPEPLITLDERGNVLTIGNKVRTEAHRLIEEFMLAANRQVALHFFRHNQPTLYRVHDRPDMEKLEAFSYILNGIGYKFPVSPQMPSHDFTVLISRLRGKPEEELINELLLRSMKKAIYQPENIGHFGLAFTHYLHFTSPIRRYPDLLVHRLLKELKDGKYPVRIGQKLAHILPNVGKQSSDMERRAMEAEREAIKAKQVAYMAGQVGSEYDGVISGVVNFGFFVRLIGPGCDGMVRASAVDDDYYHFDEPNYRLVGRRTGRKFRLGDKIRVGILKVDVEARQIDLFLPRSVEPPAPPTVKKRPRKKKS